MLKYCLIGKKLGHSFSNKIHNFVFKELGIVASYELVEVDDLTSFIKEAKTKYQGFNVTIPYKEEILPYLDYISDEAKALKNVNTVKIINNKLYGYNTDSYGFREMLNQYNIDYNNKECYILGSGGAAKTCYYSLLDKAKAVHLVSRNKKSEKIISYADLNKRNIDLLVNATPVGMYPNILDCPVNEEVLNNTKEVVDLIYNPRQTSFLKKKNSYNNGFTMLILQAIKADEIWLDCKIDQSLITKVGDLFE